MSDYLVQFNNISKFFGKVIALKDVTMKLRRGEIMCLLGDNGAGKNVRYVFGQSQGRSRKSARLHDALKRDYDWRPSFLHHSHPVQTTLRPANQQFYLGAILKPGLIGVQHRAGRSEPAGA